MEISSRAVWTQLCKWWKHPYIAGPGRRWPWVWVVYVTRTYTESNPYWMWLFVVGMTWWFVSLYTQYKREDRPAQVKVDLGTLFILPMSMNSATYLCLWYNHLYQGAPIPTVRYVHVLIGTIVGYIGYCLVLSLLDARKKARAPQVVTAQAVSDTHSALDRVSKLERELVAAQTQIGNWQKAVGEVRNTLVQVQDHLGDSHPEVVELIERANALIPSDDPRRSPEQE